MEGESRVQLKKSCCRVLLLRINGKSECYEKGWMKEKTDNSVNSAVAEEEKRIFEEGYVLSC